MTEKQYKPKHQPEKSLVQAAKPSAHTKLPEKKPETLHEEHKHTYQEQKKAEQSKATDVKDNIESKVSATDNKEDKKTDAKVEKKEAKKPEIKKKEEAVAKGMNLHASKKHCMYLCTFIKGKPIDSAIAMLQDVIKFKKVVPFKGEIPHRKEKGIMSGRYPIKASKEFIYILKALKGNAIVNGLDIDKTRIYFASASWASRPAKKGGMRFKRVNLILKARELEAKK